MSTNLISRKLLFKGEIVELKEYNYTYVESLAKQTGETIEQALERIYIEEEYESKQEQAGPNTMGYYLTETKVLENRY